MGRATDFTNCYIYHIIDSDKVVHYVGSTSNFNSRKSKHKYTCNNEHDKQHHFDIYKYIRDHGGFDNFEIVPIRKIENISNKTELRIAENDEMKKYTGLKNMRGSYLSPEKRVIQNIENSKKWRENNPGKNIENCKKWKEKNPEYDRNWAKNNPEKVKEKQRKYRENNREKISEKQRQYYQKKKQLKNNEQ